MGVWVGSSGTPPVIMDVDLHAGALEEGDLNLKHLAVQVFYHLTATIYEVA